MKQRYKTIAKVLVVLAVGLRVLYSMPFNQPIKQEISAHLYKDGAAIDQTTVFMDGEKSNYFLRRDDSFQGRFFIQSYEKTGRDGMRASIGWGDRDNMQRLVYFQNGTFPPMDVVGCIMINETMTQFAVMLTDGTVVATSDAVYEIYKRHISYDPDTGAISIVAADNIPNL
jgi:hypothetical protein